MIMIINKSYIDILQIYKVRQFPSELSSDDVGICRWNPTSSSNFNFRQGPNQGVISLVGNSATVLFLPHYQQFRVCECLDAERQCGKGFSEIKTRPFPHC